MIGRRQLPAYSPLTGGAVAAGAAALVAPLTVAERSSLVAHLVVHFAADGLLLTDGGTAALALALRACHEGVGGAAALPAYACYDLATAADGAGVPVRLYDVDPATLSPDPGSLRRAVAAGARTIVFAPLFGVPVDPAVRAAAGAGTLVIEDAAQGAGASVGGRTLGASGDLAVLSFGRGKGRTAGRGGALLAHGAAGAELLAHATRALGPARRGAGEVPRLAAQWLLGRPALYALPAALPFLRLGETIYHAPEPERGMSAVAERTLAVTWSLNDLESDVRRRNAARLLAHLGKGLAAIRPPAGSEPGYLRLPLIGTREARTAAGRRRARALGVMPGYPLALCDLPGFGSRVANSGDTFPGARLLAERLITLPTHSLLTGRDLAALEAWAGRQA